MQRLLLFLLLCLASLTALSAQKYGHLNFANLLSEMPGTKEAEAELSAFNDELVAAGEQMVKDFQARVQEVEAQVQDLPPVRVEELRVELTGEREKIARYEQQVGVDLERKRQELLGPLIEETRAATEAVAKEAGYTLVFDTSQFNSVLFAQDSDDLMPLVKAKLGL